MKYISIIDHNTNKRLAFLQNAVDVGYREEKNALWSAHFSLPADDPKNKYCDYFNYIEIYDREKYKGLYRIMPTQFDKNAGNNTIVYECEHVLATLMDDVLFGWHEIGNLGVYTKTVLQYILNLQTIKRWQLGECDFNRQFLYGWENDNLLYALFSVPNPFSDDFRWEFNTLSYPWTVSLKSPPTMTKAEIRYRKNMLGIHKSVDPTSLTTRLYALGYGEGDNQLNISGLNNGKPYLDADTQGKYGIKAKIWIDRRYQIEQSLYDAAKSMLEELKTPYTSYTVDAVHNKELQDCEVGDRIRVVDDEDGIDFYTRVIAVDKADITDRPLEATITIANKSESIASSLADIADRQRIEEAYSQGAVTLFAQNFAENCSSDYPMEIRFYIPDNVVHINQILLQGRASAFRGYTKAIEGGGASANTTGSGGGSYTSTNSGGNTSTTTGSGGSTTETSGSATLKSSNTTAVDDGGSGAANHNHGISRYTKLAICDSSYEIVGSVNWVPSGAHEHAAHSHSVSIPSHTHSVTIPSHTHSISIDSHTHSFSIPSHTHAIQYGIFTGTTASTLTITVDGNAAGSYGSSVSDLNIIPYLSKDGSGSVVRGWHTIKITPNALTRVEFELVTQLFANSRGGGQY